MCIFTFITNYAFILSTLFRWSYCAKIIMCVVNLKFPRDILLQQIFRHICDIQNIYAFKHAWKIFDIHTIMIPIHDMLIVDVEGNGDVVVQQVLQELNNIHMIFSLSSLANI